MARKYKGMTQKDIPHGNMGFNTPWTIRMAEQKFDMGREVFNRSMDNYILDPVDVRARVERAAQKALEEREIKKIKPKNLSLFQKIGTLIKFKQRE